MPSPCLGVPVGTEERSREPSPYLQAKEKASEEEEEAAPKAPPDPPVPEEPPAGEKERPEEEEDDEEEDGDLLGGFEKELEAVLLPREQMAQLKEEVKTEMEKEFDNIINEVGHRRGDPLVGLGTPWLGWGPPVDPPNATRRWRTSWRRRG